MKRITFIFSCFASLIFLAVSANAGFKEENTEDIIFTFTDSIANRSADMFVKKDTEKPQRSVFLDSVPEVAEDVEELNEPAVVVTKDYLLGKAAEEKVQVRVAIVLSDIYGKKEMEFTKGFMLGLSDSNLPKNSVALKVINGAIPEDSLVYELSYFDPEIIFTTQDQDCPQVLLDYVGEHSVRVVNVFETKGDAYQNSPSLVQILMPSQKFNVLSSKYMKKNFDDANLVIVGTADPNDNLLRESCFLWPENKIKNLAIEELSKFAFSPEEKYLIYPASQNIDDIKNLLTSLGEIQSSTGVEFTIFSRPSWVALSDLNNLIKGFDVYMPAKCYFDLSSQAGRNFITEYKNRFGLPPIKSYPVYAVMGYDMATFFLPLSLIENVDASFNLWEPTETLQLNLILDNDNWFSGRYNLGSYMLHFSPNAKMEKIPITQ